MKNFKLINNILISVIILLASFFLSLFIYTVLKSNSLIISIFVLAVFLIALITDGYLYGIISTLISVLAVNFAFTFPYFEFNFTIPENIVSALIMIVVTSLTSTLTTRIKQQEKIRIQAEKEAMRANLLRAVSHDLRTPLTSIYGSTDAVIESYNSLSDENKIKMLEGIKQDSQWLIKMVENLLSITKIDNNNLNLNKTSVVLEELIDNVTLKFKKNYSDLKLQIILPDEFITIIADGLLIEQVLLNLLENSVIHAKGMQNLILKVTKDNTKAIFEVIDDGCGILKEKLPGIFSGMYSSTSLPIDSNKRNMGIGLSVCDTIIKAHSSEIIALNNKPKGMIFKFSLDIEEADYE